MTDFDDMRDHGGEAAIELSTGLLAIDAGTAVDALTGGEPMVALRLWVTPEDLPEGLQNPLTFHISSEAALGAAQAMLAALQAIHDRSSQ